VKLKETIKSKEEQILTLKRENEALHTEIAQLQHQNELQAKFNSTLSEGKFPDQKQTNSFLEGMPISNKPFSVMSTTSNQNNQSQSICGNSGMLDSTSNNVNNSSDKQQHKSLRLVSAFLDKTKPRKSKKRVLFPPFSELQTVITCFSFHYDSPAMNSSSDQNGYSLTSEDNSSATKKRYPSSPYPVSRDSTPSTLSKPIATSFSPRISKISSVSLTPSKPSPRVPKRIPLQPIQQRHHQQQLTRVKISENEANSVSGWYVVRVRFLFSSTIDIENVVVRCHTCEAYRVYNTVLRESK
jgi:hypothetical protein